jgi:hypothetical protein
MEEYIHALNIGKGIIKQVTKHSDHKGEKIIYFSELIKNTIKRANDQAQAVRLFLKQS